MPQNGGTAEYSNLINSLSLTATKIDDVATELEFQFSQKVQESEITAPMNEAENSFNWWEILLGPNSGAVNQGTVIAVPGFVGGSLLDEFLVAFPKLKDKVLILTTNRTPLISGNLFDEYVSTFPILRDKIRVMSASSISIAQGGIKGLVNFLEMRHKSSVKRLRLWPTSGYWQKQSGEG